jgi:hypothetical protein
MNIVAHFEEINSTFAREKRKKMALGLKYFLITVFLLALHLEADGSNGGIFSGEAVVMSCLDDAGDRCGKEDFVKDTPVFPFNDMLIVKDDTALLKFRLHTHFLFDYDSRRYASHSCKLHLKNPDTTNDIIHSADYYIYTLEKIVI